MSKEPLYIVKVTIPYFYGFSRRYIAYFMTKKQAEEEFQKEKKTLLEKVSEHLESIDIIDNENEFKMFNGAVSQYAEITLTETEVNMNEEQFKDMLLKCAEDEEFMRKLRGILSNSGEFGNLIYDVNDDLEREALNAGNPYY